MSLTQGIVAGQHTTIKAQRLLYTAGGKHVYALLRSADLQNYSANAGTIIAVSGGGAGYYRRLRQFDSWKFNVRSSFRLDNLDGANAADLTIALEVKLLYMEAQAVLPNL